MKIFFLSLSVIILFIIACQKSAKPKFIEIKYLMGSIESSNSFQCDFFDKRKKTIPTDTIFINKKLFDTFYNYFTKIKIRKEFQNTCDTRFELKVDSIRTCINYSNIVCNNNNNELIETNDKIIYLIKKYSNYFNYFDTKDLKYDTLIKQYGIPDNYKFTDGRGKFPFELAHRVILIPK